LPQGTDEKKLSHEATIRIRIRTSGKLSKVNIGVLLTVY
jgi:hypothetical protein